MYNSLNGVISGNTVTNSTSYGIRLVNSNADIYGNYLTDNSRGIYLFNSPSAISGNTIVNSANTGIYLFNSTNSVISDNTAIGNKYGVYLSGSSNNNVQNNSLDSNLYGLCLYNSLNGIISGNTILNSTNYGAYLYNSTNSAVSGNILTINQYGIYLSTNSNGNTAQNNVLNGCLYGIYLYNSLNGIISGNNVNNSVSYGIRLVNSNANIYENNLTNNMRGIYISNSSDSTVSGNTLAGNQYGIYLYTNSNGNTVQNNNLNGNLYGICIYNSLNGILSGNTIINSTNYGIYLYNCTNVSLLGNILTDNQYGIYLYTNSSNNTIQNNTATGNKYGIRIFKDSNNNTIQNNSLGNNQYGIHLSNSLNSLISVNTVLNSTSIGIYLSNSTNSIISDNALTGNQYGIYLYTNSNSNAVQNNSLDGNLYGVCIYNILNGVISGNTVLNSTNYGVYLYNSTNVNLFGNNLTGNKYGIYLNTNSSNNTVQNNTVINNTSDGIFISSSNDNTVQNNTVAGSQYGIHPYNSSNISILGNTITNNQYGTYISNSAANVNFNRIVENSIYGLYSRGNSTVNATNNWWGSNNPTISSTVPSDIRIAGGTVIYDPWLILNVTASPNVIGNNNSTITADLTHNNKGEDTSPRGHVPDDIPVSFITNIGTVTNSAYTRNGKASATFNRGTATSGTADITATVDNQAIQTNVTITIDTAPTVTANLSGGVYSTIQTVNLIATDDNDLNPVIYYTLNGSNPTTLSTVYTGPISIITNTVLKFIAVDSAGNQAQCQTEKYYFRIQDAINDPLTSNGTLIEVHSGTYVENIVVNKNLTIRSATGESVTIQPADWSQSIITINSSGSGSTIHGLNINGGWDGIYLDSANNCIITENNISNNGNYGVNLGNSLNAILSGNTILNNWYGIYLNFSSNNTLSGNNITDNWNYGIYIYNSPENTLQNNVLVNNYYNFGVSGENVSDYVQNIDTSNTINENTIYYLVGQSGLVFDGTIMGYLGLISCDDIHVNNVTLTGNANGLLLVNTTNSTFENCNLTDNENGIYLLNSSNNTLSGNTVTNNWNGIYIYNSPGNTLQNNVLADNYGDNFGVFGDNVSDYVQNIDTSNTINENPIYYLVGQNNLAFDGVSIGYLALVSCDNIQVRNIAITSNGQVLLADTTNSIIENCDLRDSYDNGIYLWNSLNNIISGVDTTWIILNSSNNNTIVGSDIRSYINRGISLLNSSNNNITGNNIYCAEPRPCVALLISNVSNNFSNDIDNMYIALYLESSFNNTISENTISGDNGIYLDSSSNNTLSGNNITDNWNYGICINNSPENTLQNNVLANNQYNFGIFGENVSDYVQNIDTSNTINENTIYYLVGQSGLVFDGTIMGYLGLISCDNIQVNNVTLTGNDNGLLIINTTNSTFENCNLTDNENGIYLWNSSNNTISFNNITDNTNGIILSNSSANINFNRIAGNSDYGLYNEGNGTVDATNNWWGSNNPVVSSSSGSDIYITNGTVNYNPWLVVTINATPNAISSQDTAQNATIIVDMTHNSDGNDTSSQGHVPDDIPISFITNLGTVTTSAYTRNGRANATFNREGCPPGMANITATIDNQDVQTIITLTNVVWYVNNTSIQDAINAASPYDTIQVGNGTYTENIVVNKPLIIRSASGANVTIHALNPSNPVFTLNCNNAIIQGFTITGATSSDGITIQYLSSFNNTIQNNTVINNGGYGISVYTSNNIIQNNTVTNNGLDGIYIQSSLNNIVQNNVVTNNGGSGIHIRFDPPNNIVIFYAGGGTGNTGNGSNGSGSGAILVTYDGNSGNNSNNLTALLELITNGSVNNIVQNNIVTNNGPYGIYIESTSNNLVQNNVVTNNSGSGIHLWTSSYNIIHMNNATNNGGSGIYLYSCSSNNLIQYNTANNNINGILIDGGSSDNIIRYSTVTNNEMDGIYVNYGSELYVNFNRIAGNGRYGLYSYYTPVNATNNWWGSNINPLNFPSNIYIANAALNCSTWLILNISSNIPSSTNRDYSITADLTHNSNGEDTSSSGNIPDGTPVSFITTFGTVETVVYTNKGKAISTLKSNVNGVANVTATLDNQNISKIVNLGVYDITTQTEFSSIQDAINNASPGNIIGIYNGNYTENIVINKNLTITSNGANPLITGSITIGPDGSNSIIQGLTFNGNINLYANNCTIYGNTIIGNGTSGILASNSFNNTIFNNTITSNGFDGIHSSYSNNTIYGNTIYGSNSGIYSEYSTDTIISNNLTNNYYGIWTYDSTDTIEFNRISGNTYGLRNDIGTVNATNNWWGSNTDPLTNSSKIWNVSGTVICNSWLVLSLNASSTNSGGNTSVTADLTHNDQGGDTSSQGHVPNGIPVNFTTTFGTIIGSAYTVKGKSSTILNMGSTQTATVTATASLDNQNVSTTGVISTGSAVLNITSTAIDNSTGLPLNTTYTIPLNNSVTWLSVLWINTGMFSDELQIIVDGTVVQNRYFHNAAYMTWQNSYSSSVFTAILYTNRNLQFVDSDPTELTAFWNNLTTMYNLTSSELEFVQNHRQDFIDNMTFNIVYSGVPGFNITVTDPHNSTHVTNLNFPGNVIQRTSQIVYQSSPYEGVKSFAIATTNVTDNILQYWVNQYPLYQSLGAMNAAYGTFLAALLVESAHDQVADNITAECNVTWSRTSPIIVSVGDEVYETYLTLECDHGMGMTVVGTPENLWIFNFVTSNCISPMEYLIMCGASGNLSFQSCSVNGVFNSVMMDLLRDYSLNSTSVEVFVQNGFIIEKSAFNDDNFIVIDLETGVVRDINTVNNFCGTEAAYSKSKIKLCITGGFYLPDDVMGDEVDLGVNFWWDGLGRVYIANPSAKIAADDALMISGPCGSMELFYGYITAYGPNIDITSLLRKGENNVQVSIKNYYPNMIGCSPLYLCQVYPVGNFAYQSLQHINPLNYISEPPLGYPDHRPEPAKHGMKWNDWDMVYGGAMIIGGGSLWIGGCLTLEGGIGFPMMYFGNSLLSQGVSRVIKGIFQPSWVNP